MLKYLSGLTLAGVLATASIAEAQTAAPSVTDVVNNFLGNVRITINGQSLSALSAAQIASGLAANVQIETKANGAPVITLKNDVSVDIRTGNGLSAPIANFTLEQETFRLDPDPVVSYGVSVRNLQNSTQNYVYTWPLLFSPAVSGETLVKSSLTGTLTDTNGNGATLSPVGPAIQTAIAGFPFTSMGVDVGNTSITAAANGSQSFAFYNPGPAPGANYAPGPTGNFTFMNVATTFSLSARDRVSMTGFTEIVPVPEPSTYAMLLAGLVFAGVVACRRRTTSTN